MVKRDFKSGIYTSWSQMKARCLNYRNPNYPRYGGRGITVSEEWLKFDNFHRDMFGTWSQGLTLERVNNNGNYCKSNCKWADRKEQALNTRNVERSLKYTFNGITLNTRQWANKLGINRTTLDMRLREYKWPLEKALARM